jgi:Winged helix DNA-binding domain
LPNATEADVERALAARTIVRTWPMRGTLHFVAAADVRWILELLTPRIVAGSAGRNKQLELDDAVFARSRDAFINALQGGRQLSRQAMYAVLEAAQISTAGQRGLHILWRLAQDQLICFGARAGKQQTFALLDEWVPAARSLERDEALAELAERYFTGHGPATLEDFVWWSGLKIADARAGLAMAASRLAQDIVDTRVYWMAQDVPAVRSVSPNAFLLPGFDEFLLGYRDRSAALDPRDAQKVHPGGNGMFSPTIVLYGRVAGTWKRTLKRDAVAIEASPFSPLSKADKQKLATVVESYGNFLDMAVSFDI